MNKQNEYRFVFIIKFIDKIEIMNIHFDWNYVLKIVTTLNRVKVKSGKVP